ncbi:L,D-transpeptidase family protein [Lichenihabitans psoromatis]|uniref:L,D-transpeptidase family protein n=1 Tax=Lichenihabitans psoromatis TaxID=2528642 RepID=UPI00103852FE|nr:murein L,D-transpeptidase family protein [Lichenihabitans psoromatis]
MSFPIPLPHRRGPAKLLAALLVFLALAGCAGQLETVRTGTVSPATLETMNQLNMDRRAPILVRILKEEKVLEVWKQDRSGRYRPLKSYEVCRYSGVLGPKKQEGDHQSPEGFYAVAPGQMNPKSREYLSFNIGYPNAFDQSLGRTGDSLMVHGGCRSVGCYAMTNEQIEEIYGLAYEAFAGGQMEFQIQAYPFHMTAANLQRHATDPNLPFWLNLKTGSDLFEATKTPPQVGVCNGRYMFGAAAAGVCTVPPRAS